MNFRCTVATLLPGVEFSTKQPYPDARRLLDAPSQVHLAYRPGVPLVHRVWRAGVTV